MIRKLLIIVTAAIGAVLTASSQTDAAMEAFINAPLGVFPSIDRMTRMDMADYFNSGSQKPSKNNFKGDARIVAATPGQVTFTTGDVTQVELSLLPAKSDTIVMVITTLKTPVPDSNVKFYTRGSWEPVAGELFKAPGLDEWSATSPALPRADLENEVPFILASATYDPAAGVLTLRNNTAEYLPRENAGKVKGSLRDTLTYRWNGARMTKDK